MGTQQFVVVQSLFWVQRGRHAKLVCVLSFATHS